MSTQGLRRGLPKWLRTYPVDHRRVEVRMECQQGRRASEISEGLHRFLRRESIALALNADAVGQAEDTCGIHKSCRSRQLQVQQALVIGIQRATPVQRGVAGKGIEG